MTNKAMAGQQEKFSQDEFSDFYQGDAAKLGEFESVGYLIKIAAANILRNTCPFPGMGSKITSAPALLASMAVLSEELLSQT